MSATAYTIVDMTDVEPQIRLQLGKWTERVHTLDDLSTARRRRTQFANKYPYRAFFIPASTIHASGKTENEWV